MVAQDSVNQGAALLLTTVGKARELDIPESNWVYMHGAAKGSEYDMSVRPDPSMSPKRWCSAHSKWRKSAPGIYRWWISTAASP